MSVPPHRHDAAFLTIGELAAYAGVTVRAVRHYHAKGLLAEPERDESGYRRYGPAAVVELIKIRTLADAGVPLARIHELLTAGPDELAAAVADIDERLRHEIAEREQHRQRIAQLSAGDALVVPTVVADYLDRLRRDGAVEEMVRLERDMWILVAARWPDEVPTMIADKVAQLDNPRVARLHQLLGEVGEAWERGGPAAAEPALAATTEVLHELFLEAELSGQMELQPPSDDAYTQLMDAFANDAHPSVARLQELLAERGWTGWSHVRRSTA